MKVKLLVVDDHPLARAGVRTLLSRYRHIRIVAEAGTGQEALQLVQEALPDVVLMDIGLPDMDGAEATRNILAVRPDVVVVALTVSDRDVDARRMLESGAIGYVLKDAAPDELARAIDSAQSGHLSVDRRVGKAVIGTNGELGPAAGLRLAPNEKRVLRLLVKGYPNKRIARELKLSEATIKFYVHVLYTKLEVDNRAGAATRTASLHLFDDPD